MMIPDHRQILDHLSIGVVILEQKLGVVFWNRWMSEHSGIPLEKARGRAIHAVFPELVRKGFVKRAREAFRHGDPVFFTNKVHQTMFPFYAGRSYLEKRLRPMQQTVILSPIKDEDGRVARLMLTVFDITDWIDYRNRLLQSKEELEKLSRTDELTRLPNRRFLLDRFNQELFHHNRRNRALALAILDLDLFKEINDRHGHQAGDQVLFEFGRILDESCRDYDIVGRYGGEEFVVVLPDTDSSDARAICERIRKRIENHPFDARGHGIRITTSIGIACKPAREKTTADELFQRADAALYRAKEAGRNRVETG